MTSDPQLSGPAPVVVALDPVPDVMAALRAFAASPDVLLFDSALQRGSIGRYSFLCADPYDFVELSRVAPGDSPFESLRQRLTAVATHPDLPPFQGGAAGQLGFDLAHAFEVLPHARCDEFRLPALAVGLYDWVIAWDHGPSNAWLISQGFPETEPARRTIRARERADAVLAQLASDPRPGVMSAQKTSAPPKTSLTPQWPAPGLAGLTSNFTRDAYLAAIERAIDYIHAGDIFQVNLSQRLLCPATAGPLELYRRLRQQNAATFAGYFAHADWTLLSASPERFLSVRGDVVETRPIKGTRRRAAGPEADLYTQDELRESLKDQAENVMIVDLLRNDLSRVCQPGSVRVPQLCGVETYATVQHLVSVVTGRLAPDCDVWDLLAATFPGGSISGAPKVRALEIIAELEPTARGPYCGCLFYAGANGTFDSSILIRTFTQRHGWLQFPVGGGIVAQSRPEQEYAETLHKAEGLLRALRDG